MRKISISSRASSSKQGLRRSLDWLSSSGPALMMNWSAPRRAWRLGAGLLVLAVLAGCGGVGVGYYGPDYDAYYGPGFYGDGWGPDAYVFGHGHGRWDHDFGRRGFESRSAAHGFHGGGGFAHGGGGHGGGHGR